MTVQQLSDRLLELSHQHGLAQAKVCFVLDRQLVDVKEVNVLGNNLVMLSNVYVPSTKQTEEAENSQTDGDWVVRDKEPL